MFKIVSLENSHLYRSTFNLIFLHQVLTTTVLLACVYGAPYDNPTKSGTLQEVSKYHVTAQNKDSPAVAATRLDRPSPVNPAVISDPAPAPKNTPTITRLTGSEEEKLRKTRENASQKPAVESHSDSYGQKIKTIQGPTTVAAPTTVKVQPAVVHEHKTKRSADHTAEHTKATEELKKTADQEKTKEDQVIAAGAKKPEEFKRTNAEVSRKPLSKRESDSVKVQDRPQVNVKPVEEQKTTEKAPASTTASYQHLSPTSVHTSFSNTWTRPQAQAQPAVVAQKDQDKVPAASDNKPILATIDPLKPVNDAKTSTTTVAPSSSTTSAGHIHRSRRGVDETEAQDEPKDPKPTKAWWRSLDLNKKEKEEVKPEVVSAQLKETKKPVELIDAQKDKANHKRETVEADKTSTAAPIQKPNRQSEPLQSEVDNKPPQFVRPVPVAQVLGHKEA